ncbi:hypothetical protein L596_003946 [Steinernema carpocapsae]|uniref:Uncharacterized protein n=2 Tax=Steinernema carpocapsae TaxID=34508 RepID=A0A4U8UY94_STECR|nr:hypothetical protein L596_003946 [Steinernema carpocapsae]
MLCTAPIAPQMNGELFENGRVAKEQSSFVRDPASCAKLFERTSTRIYSGQREFNCDRVVHFDQESYSRLLNVCNEARSDDDSLSVCETDVTLPDSASLCERKPSFSTSSTTHSFFGDPRDEEDRDALEMSNASLAVQTGNYDTSVEFNLEDFEHGNMRRYRRGSQTTPSLTSSEYSESDSSNEPGCRKRRKVPYSPVFEFEVENDKDRDQFSFDDYYLKNEDDGNWTMSKEPIGEKTAARKTQEKDRSSLARKFPKKFPYDSDASKTDAKSDCSSLREGRFMTDEEIYVGLKEFKSSKLNVVSKPSIQRKDPFADFSIDEQAYQGTSNPNSRKVVDKNWYSEIEYAGSEDCNPNGEDTSGAIRLSKKEKKKRKWRNPVKNLFRRASKKVTG